MNNKKVIPIIFLVIVIVAIGFYILLNNKNKIVSIITIDINPSIEIALNKDEKVVRIVAINEDGKSIISNDLKGKSLNDTIDTITNNIVDKGYIDEDYVAIIIHTEGNISNEKIESTIKEHFNNKQINSEVIFIDEITDEDKEIAKKYNISSAKASYIQSVLDVIDNIDLKEFSDKSIDEIKETKDTGNYCPNGYILDGQWCIKEIDRKKASSGNICPKGYLEYNETCYMEAGMEETGNTYCPDEFTLEKDKCVRKSKVDAIATGYSCSSGMVRTKSEVGMTFKDAGDRNDPVCVGTSITHPVSVCDLPADDPTERMSYGGKCYWHRAPVIESGCPGKIEVAGFCWDDASNIYLCPYGNNSNTRTKDDNCYTVLNIKPTPNGYKCENENMILEGNKCIIIENIEPFKEMVCPKDTTLINSDRCIYLNMIKNKIEGYICDFENSKIKGDECIIYETTDVLHN